MTGGRIGRIIVASLHQAIADIAPTRLDFYENWLNAEGLRHGTIGLPAMMGVVGFLRGEDTYELIMTRAGEYAGTWSAAGLPAPKRMMLRLMPAGLRSRWSLQLARAMIGATYPATRTTLRIRRRRAVLEIRGSLFCDIREAPPFPLCTFYAAAVARLLEALEVPAKTHISACHALGARMCSLSVVVGSRTTDDEEVAAA